MTTDFEQQLKFNSNFTINKLKTRIPPAAQRFSGTLAPVEIKTDNL